MLVDVPLLIVEVVVVPEPEPLVVIERDPETIFPGYPPFTETVYVVPELSPQTLNTSPESFVFPQKPTFQLLVFCSQLPPLGLIDQVSVKGPCAIHPEAEPEIE